MLLPNALVMHLLVDALLSQPTNVAPIKFCATNLIMPNHAESNLRRYTNPVPPLILTLILTPGLEQLSTVTVLHDLSLCTHSCTIAGKFP